MMIKEHYIIKIEDKYALVEAYEYNGRIFSKVLNRYNTIDEAEKKRIISRLYEDGVPVNASSSGMVKGLGNGPDDEPPVKTALQKLLHRRKKRKMNTGIT